MASHKSPGGGPETSPDSSFVHIVVIILAAACVLLWKLGSGSLAPWDEAIYAQAAKETAQGGGWLTLHWEHQPWFEKPPLLIWITAALFRLFGVSEFWARAPSALSGVALVALTYSTGRLAYDKRVGLLAAAILLTGYHFLSFARFGTTDVMLALFTLLAVNGYLRLREGRQNWWYLIWLAVASALMLKGAGGLIAPASVALALALDGRLGAALRAKDFWLGGLLALALVAPWHVLMYAQHGRAFAGEYFGYHVFSRLSRPLEGNPTGYLYYVARLVDGFFPWVLLVPFALVSAVRENVRGDSRSRVFLAVFALVFGVFTLIPTRRPWYIVPLYPALAILVAALVVRFYRTRSGRPIYRRVVLGACAVLLLAGGAYSILSLYLNRTGEAPLARLSRLAASTNPGDREPLIIFSESEPTPAQVPLFYSDRPVRQAYTDTAPGGEDARRYVNYERLPDVLDGAPKRIILSKDDSARLSAAYDINVVAEAGQLVYATIRRRD